MSRSRTPLFLAVLAVALAAVPAVSAKGRDHRAARIQGVCSQQSTSSLKLGREDRGIEVEFQVDQNRNGIPWRVELSRNGAVVASFVARTHAPSGSFEIRRVIAGRLGVDRITAVGTRASGETCTAGNSARKANAAPAAAASAPVNAVADDHGDDAAAPAGTVADDHGDDAGDDHGHHSGGHS
jgi:hypothetical protein